MKRIVCDIGGTHTRVAKGDRIGFTTPVMYDTPQEYSTGLHMLEKVLRESGLDDVHSIVVGVPGVLTEQKNSLYSAPNIPLWVGHNLLSDIQRQTGISDVRLVNDTALVGLGEAIVGAGSGYEIVAYMTISTGVGGVRIVNKKIDNTNEVKAVVNVFIKSPN
jgi:glucokinase